MSRLILVLGGARSGKSTWAERHAAASGRPVVYLATAAAGDDEMAERIAAHRADRPDGWRTVEEPLDLVGALRRGARAGDLVLVDCLTLWVSNVVLARLGTRAPEALARAEWRALEDDLVASAGRLVAAARELDADLIAVSNEVGMGLVPPYPLGRRYRDALGRVNQIVAAAADEVLLMVAGLAVDLRRLARPPGG